MGNRDRGTRDGLPDGFATGGVGGGDQQLQAGDVAGDLRRGFKEHRQHPRDFAEATAGKDRQYRRMEGDVQRFARRGRSEEHTSELQSLMRISYSVFCLNKKLNYRCTLPYLNTSSTRHL